MNIPAVQMIVGGVAVVAIGLLAGAGLVFILIARWVGWLADARRRIARWQSVGQASIHPSAKKMRSFSGEMQSGRKRSPR